jgi:hypothetical protein
MENKAQIRKWKVIGAVALFVFALQQSLFAGIAVSPLTQKIEVKPGKKTNFVINVSNNQRNEQTKPCPLKIDILDFMVSDTGQLSFGPEYKNPRSAASWITLDVNQLTLNPGESKEIKGTVTAPIDADGDYWASAMVAIGETKEDAKGVQVQLRTATGLFIRVMRRSPTERGDINDVNIKLPEFETGPVKKELSKSEIYTQNEKQSLKIEVKLKNNGIFSIPAIGKAYIYSDTMKKIATVPLYASRNNVLPGDSRWFSGIMSQPLPAGKYKLRTIFSSENKTRHPLMKESEFTITNALATTWQRNIGNDNKITKLELTPEKFDFKLNPGRLTAANFQVKNQGLNTVSANCRIEGDRDWLELKNPNLTLAPNSGSAMSCTIKVPSDAKTGNYKWNLVVEMEESGLENLSSGQPVQYRIPVSVTIDENTRTAAKD